MISLSLAVGLVVTIILVMLLPAQISEATGDTHCVVPEGTTPGPFAACDQVFTVIQDAVDAALDGEEILIAAGVYTDVHTHDGLTQTVYLEKGVTLRGGYAPPFDDPPDPEINLTVLDAQGRGRVLYITGPVSPAIEGLHITGGDATGLAGHMGDDAGGGVYVVTATVTFSDSVISGNIATRGPGWGHGGGVYLSAGGATFVASAIEENVASSGDDGTGGGVSAYQSVVTFTESRIISNVGVLSGTVDASSLSFGWGGGVALVDSNGAFEGNTFRGNIGNEFGQGSGGGLYVEGSSQVTLSDNVIRDNVASVSSADADEDGVGGGVYVSDAPNPYAKDDYPMTSPSVTPEVMLSGNMIVGNVAMITGTLGIGGGFAAILDNENIPAAPNITLTNNAILRNTAVVSVVVRTDFGAGLAGGAAIAGGNAVLMNNTVLSNTAVFSYPTSADAVASAGGGLYLGGIFSARSQAELDGNVIQGNVASDGAAIIFDFGETTVVNTAIVDNRTDNGSPGLAIIGRGVEVNLVHATIAGNQGGDGSAITMGIGGGFPPGEPPVTLAITNTIVASQTIGIDARDGSTVTVNGILWHNVPTATLNDGTATVHLANQFFGDPRFTFDGYHIRPDSAAIMQGVTTAVRRDIDGQTRGSKPDLGADEYWGEHNIYLPCFVFG